MDSRGFSLVETLLYAALVASVFALVVGVFLGLSRSLAGLSVARDLASSASASLERIVRDARAASSLSPESVLGANPSRVVLLSPDGARTEFFVEDGALRVAADGVDLGPLTGSAVSVDSFTASFHEAGGGRLLTVRLTLTARRGSAEKTASFAASAVLRGGYRDLL